nr:hypothetical protein [Chloroflexus aggregans]
MLTLRFCDNCSLADTALQFGPSSCSPPPEQIFDV